MWPASKHFLLMLLTRSSQVSCTNTAYVLADLFLHAITPKQLTQNADLFSSPMLSQISPLLHSIYWLPVAAHTRFIMLSLHTYPKDLIKPSTVPHSLQATAMTLLIHILRSLCCPGAISLCKNSIYWSTMNDSIKWMSLPFQVCNLMLWYLSSAHRVPPSNNKYDLPFSLNLDSQTNIRKQWFLIFLLPFSSSSSSASFMIHTATYKNTKPRRFSPEVCPF